MNAAILPILGAIGGFCMRTLAFVFAPLAVFLGACNPVANFEEGGKSVERWQELYNAGDRDRLWGMTGKEFREVTSREQLNDLYTVVSARMGKVQSSERSGFNVNSTPAGTRTVIGMNTQFEQGEGTETFTFIGQGEDMKVIGWTVNSPRLTLTPDDVADELEKGE